MVHPRLSVVIVVLVRVRARMRIRLLPVSLKFRDMKELWSYRVIEAICSILVQCDIFHVEWCIRHAALVPFYHIL